MAATRTPPHLHWGMQPSAAACFPKIPATLTQHSLKKTRKKPVIQNGHTLAKQNFICGVLLVMKETNTI